MSVNHLRGSVEWTLVVALVFGAAAIAQAQQDADAQDEPQVIQIGPDDRQPDLPPPDEIFLRPGDRGVQAAAAPYWIGLAGGPVSEELRHHIDLPEDQGLVVREVMPNSPAAKAGLQRFDILVRANDTELSDLSDLVDIVAAVGAQEGQIALEILRRGQRETIYVTPEERPADAAMPREPFGDEFARPFGDAPGLDPRDLLRRFGERGIPQFPQFEFPREFGPGVLGRPLAELPAGVSIRIHKEGDQPAHVTVERDGERWEVVADDPESLDALPDDLRPLVEQMLDGRGVGQLPRFRVPIAVDQEEIHRRLREMEQRMEEMQRRLFGNEENR